MMMEEVGYAMFHVHEGCADVHTVEIVCDAVDKVFELGHN